jgi:hypothetical protein
MPRLPQIHHMPPVSAVVINHSTKLSHRSASIIFSKKEILLKLFPNSPQNFHSLQSFFVFVVTNWADFIANPKLLWWFTSLRNRSGSIMQELSRTIVFLVVCFSFRAPAPDANQARSTSPSALFPVNFIGFRLETIPANLRNS